MNRGDDSVRGEAVARWTTVVSGAVLIAVVAYTAASSGASGALLSRMALFAFGFLLGGALARLAGRRVRRRAAGELASALVGGAGAWVLFLLLPEGAFPDEEGLRRVGAWFFFVGGTLMALVVVPLQMLARRRLRAYLDGGAAVPPPHASSEKARGEDDHDLNAGDGADGS